MKSRQPKTDMQANARNRTSSRCVPLVLGLALVAATFAAHHPALHSGYIWDDEVTLYANPLIKAPVGLYIFWFNTQTQDYWPLSSTMLWIEWRIWGNKPMPYHAVNIALHAVAAVLLWRMLLCLKINKPGAFLAAAIFAVHPVTVESVAWISERKNILSMVLYLLSILAYLRFEEQNQRKWYVFALIAAVAALLAKTSVVALPVILLLLSWWRLSGITRQTVIRLAPFFLLSLILGLVTIWFQSHNSTADWVVRPEGLASRVASVGWVVWFYLYKIVMPINLAMVYPRWDIDGSCMLSFVPLALLLACSFILWYYRKGWGRGPLAALGSFVIVLAPVLGLLDMTYARYSLVADHLQYPGMPGLMALLGGGIGAAWSWARREGKRDVATGAAVAAFIIVATLGVLTFRQARVYRDDITLWTHTLALNDRSWGAYNNRGMAYGAMGAYDQAIQDCTKAIELKPDLVEAYSNLGSTYGKKGLFDRAIKECTKAIELKPDCAEAYSIRGSAYSGKGSIDQAIQDFTKAIELKPNLSEAYSNRGGAYSGKGLLDQAIQDCTIAIGLRPDFAEAYCNRGNALGRKGLFDPSIRDCTRAIELEPNYPEAYAIRGNGYVGKGSIDHGMQDFAKAVELNPAYAAAYMSRAVTYYILKDYDKSWANVKMLRQLGETPRPDFLQNLINDSGRTE